MSSLTPELFDASTVDGYASIPAAFFDLATQFPDRVLYRQAIHNDAQESRAPRRWLATSYSTARERIVSVASSLQNLGIARGDRVAIVSSSRPEWVEADIAILSVGGVVVSVYQSLPSEDIGYILYDSQAEIVFAENQEQVDKLLELSNSPVLIPATEEREESSAELTITKIIVFDDVASHPLVVSFSELISTFSNVTSVDYYRGLNREDLAALVYTSGTTGPPKGVMQTHGNHLSNVRQAWESSLCDSESQIMLFLPLAHSFAKLMGYLGFLTPARLAFPAIVDRHSSKLHPNSVTKDIAESNSSVIPVVPRMLEKMQSGIEQRASGAGAGSAFLRWALNSAKEVYQARFGDKKSLSYVSTLLFHFTAGVRRKIEHKLFGSNFRYCISGGAKLNPHTAHFFDALGLEILEGYGLTETCVATNANREGQKKIGTVGPVLSKDIELRLADDGEILFRGPNVAKGYFNRAQATAAAWDEDGWFHTGDLGSIDDEGYLAIVGRKKEILVTSYGKNVAPEEIEAALRSSPYISQAVLVGDGRPFCTAILTVDKPVIDSWIARTGLSPQEADFLKSTELHELVWSEVEGVNQELANFESIKKISILPGDFTVENGFLTPTFKVKRKMVIEKYKEVIEGMYRD